MGNCVKINRISAKHGKIYISVCKDANTYLAEESEVLTALYGEVKDWDRVYSKLIREVVAGRVQLIGRHGRVGYVRGVIESLDDTSIEELKQEDAEVRGRLSDAEIGARIATVEEAIRPSLKPWVIEMRDGEVLAGVYIFKIGDDDHLTPYSTSEVPIGPKFFLSKDQAMQYLEVLKAKCPLWTGYNFQLRQRANSKDFEGVAKIGRFCTTNGIEFVHVKTVKDSNGCRVKNYGFPTKRWYRLEAQQNSATQTTYRLICSGKIDTEATNQLQIIERLRRLFKIEDGEGDTKNANI